MYFIFTLDYILMPLYIVLAWGLMNAYFKRKHGYNPKLKKYFNRGLLFKIIGCLSIGLIYEHYYDGAYDGRFYFEGGKLLSNYWLDHPSEIINTLFSSLRTFNDTNLDGLSGEDAFIFADTSWAVCKFVAVFNIFSFNSFLPASLFFCVFAFMAIWNLFVFFVREFGLSFRLAALCTIFIPSVLIWGSGIFKDTISFSALCWLFICGYYSFIKPTKVLTNIAGFAASAFLIFIVKDYIVIAFAPFFILYVFNAYKSRITNAAVRTIATPLVLLITVGSIVLFLLKAGEVLGRYSLGQVLETASTTSYYITAYGGAAGSAYTLDVDFSSPIGLLAAIPASINITLFRPYPWEYLKPFILFASAESMAYLYFTLMVFFRGGIGKSFRIIWKTPVLQFCVLFSFLFAFMVGISAANFGTLVRYKIPCLSFYAFFLVLLYKLKFPGKAVEPPRPVSQRKPAHFA